MNEGITLGSVCGSTQDEHAALAEEAHLRFAIPEMAHAIIELVDEFADAAQGDAAMLRFLDGVRSAAMLGSPHMRQEL